MNNDEKTARATSAPVKTDEVEATCCTAPLTEMAAIAPKKEPWITGSVTTMAGDVPKIRTELSFADTLGSWCARWTIGRMNYNITPGLYAVGDATHESPVLVTANYKMSFDRLRTELRGLSAWILVLDTKGINVWCAAGEGAFGTEEVLTRLEAASLGTVVSHRTLILPQLGATGVSAHEVRSRSGFRAVYGPVRAKDIPQFLDARMKATPEMRRVRFDLRDRVVLIPADLVMVAKHALLIAIILFALSSLGTGVYLPAHILANGLRSGLLLLVVALVPAALTPLLLPWLPGRPFALKGLWIGLAIDVAIAAYFLTVPGTYANWAGLAAWLLIAPAAGSFVAMLFTGSATDTSLSGVQREMRLAMPIQIVCATIALGLWVTGILI